MAQQGLTCIIEDSADYRLVLQQHFSRFLADYPVLFFATSQAFLDELSTLSPLPSLILLDWFMPLLGECQTLLHLKALPECKTIPILMMSTNPSPIDIAASYHAGASGFLFKIPLSSQSSQELSDVIRFWIDA